MAFDNSKKFIDDGNPDFKSLVTGGGLYVDKTKFIEVLENIGRFNIVLRPKRFGKSLFTSMLMYYYDADYTNEFDALFGGFYIHQNKTKEANSYNVLKFDFSGIESDRIQTESDFNLAVRLSIEDLIYRKKLNITLGENLSTAAQILKTFLACYKRETETKIYLLIDEYDNFANAVLGKDFNYFKDITGKAGFVRAFYEVFKEFAGNLIERVYITGVTPITLDALASGFNFVINRSFDPRLNNMIGFSQEDIDWMLQYYEIEPVHKEVMREYYNGYVFDNESDNLDRIYNSTLVFYYLAKVIWNQAPPVDLIDARISSDPAMVKHIIDLYGDTDAKLEIMKTIHEKVDLSARLLLKFRNEGFMESRDDLLSMLYYLGFLTIRKNIYGESLLITPNRTVEVLYSELYLRYISNLLVPSIAELSTAVNKMLHLGETEDFRIFLEKNLSQLCDHDFDHMNEQGIKNFIIAYLRLYQNIHLETELDVEKGRIDVAILPALLHTFSHYYVIEIKYISKAKDSATQRKEKRKEALTQLNKYKHCHKVLEAEKIALIHKLIILVVKDEVSIEEVE
jgi:hypothetical protein